MKANLQCLLTLVLVFTMSLTFVQAQTMQVNGTVTDESGVPIPGVNITVEGTTSGTSTDFDGNYSIAASQGQILHFSSVGFQDLSVTVGTEGRIDVTLEQGTALDEVVVTAFGRKMTRNEMTSNSVTVSSEDLQKSPFVNVQQGLQGKVPGLTLSTSSGAPGAAPQILIRGMSSINASNRPLYVIDGVPVNSDDISGDSSITQMDPLALLGTGNVESVTVLKDAAAVAPYGADGSNGVILITTKSGKKGAARYNFNYTVGVQNDARPGLKMANAEQRAEIIAEGMMNGFGLGSPDEVWDFLIANGIYDYEDWNDLGRPDNNWKKLVENKDALTMNADFSVSQGTERSNFYAGLGFNKTEATVIGTEFKRWSGNFKYETELNDKLHLQIGATVSNVNQDGVLENAAYFGNPNLSKYFMSPWATPYNEDGSLKNDDSFFDLSGGLHNVLYTQKTNINNNNVTRALPNASLTWQILDNLTFNTKLGLDYTLRYFKQYQNPIHGDGDTDHGYVFESSLRRYSYTTQNSLDYTFTLGESNNFRLTALQEFTKYKSNSLSGEGSNFPNEFLKNLSSASADFNASSSFSDQMQARYVGMLSYNFDQKYLLDASYSYQGDSRFSEQYGSFYSVGLAWNLHNEDFIKNVDNIDELRLKFGYGITGNAGIGRNKYQALMEYRTYQDQPAAILSGYGTDATWEKGRKIDAGTNFSLFDFRLNGSVGIFFNKTTDMLLNVPLPYSATFISASVLRNVGEMTNNGFEVSLDGDIIRTPDFKWNLGGNFATLNNKVTSIPEDGEIISATRVVQEGHKVYEWRMPEWAGVDSDNGDPLWYVDRSVNDETTNKYAEAEEQYTGYNALPKYSGAIFTRLDYKNFFLEGTLNFSGGNKVYEDWTNYIQPTAVDNILGFNTSQDAYNGAWRQPGDNATYPRFDYGDGTIGDAAAQVSTRWLHDGDFMRLRDVALGYTFKRDQLRGTFLEGLTLSVRGTNLWTWVKDKTLKWDPEVRLQNDSVLSGGFTNLTTPPIKTVTFNVNINF